MPHKLVIEFEARRTKAGVPLRQILKKTGIAASTVWRWHNVDDAVPNIRIIERLNIALDAIVATRFED